MQLVEVAGVLAFVLLGLRLLWEPVQRLLDDRGAVAHILLGTSFGLLGSALALIFTTDIFPDRFEPISRVVLLVGVVAEVILLGIREMR